MSTLVQSRAIETPDWVKHAVFYQIFPDRFARSHNPPTKLPRVANWEPWDALPTAQGYKGGDLWGVLEQLDYLQELGITAIYFTPVFQSACNHRYHTHDYYQVDPILGGNAALRSLLDSCHQRSMKVVLDGVFNHCSRGFFFFNDILENGPYSPWIDWFRIEGWPLAPYRGDLPANYISWWDNRALPVFNHDNTEVQDYLLDIAEYWLNFGIDGWRLDVPNEITTPGFWQAFRQRVKAVNPDAYIVGEIWGDALEWLDGSQFDGVMNYLFTGPTIAFTAGDRVIRKYVEGRSYHPYPSLSATAYADKIQALLERYPWEVHLSQLNLLASHDTARLLTIAGDDVASVELATLLLLTFPGAPSIYYGDEVGLPGGIDPDSRRSFPARSTWNHTLMDYHQSLIALRHAHPVLRIGAYHSLYAQGDVYVFARVLETTAAIVAVNVGTDPVQITIPTVDLPTLPEKPLFGFSKFYWEGNVLHLTLPGRSGQVLG
jgi:cyclomaltodextrinase/neopullulanase